jgi:hypothetical protein
MKVKELIEILRLHDQELTVLTSYLNPDFGHVDFNHINAVLLEKMTKKMYCPDDVKKITCLVIY